MDHFMIRFLLCNLLLSGIIGVLLVWKRLLKNSLSSRMQYNLWFLLLGLLAVPFLPAQKINFAFQNASAVPIEPSASATAAIQPSNAAVWINEIGVTVSSKTPSGTGILFCILWLSGIAGMTVWLMRSVLCFHKIKLSALPLQNPVVHKLYCDCLAEMNIRKKIPVYSTAFLKSPVIAGFFRPCILLPIHLISDNHLKDIRYMLLHELQHYKHKDALVNYITCIASILYWFNPVVWYAFREMKNDREVACDTSVLEMLEADAYEEYGNTLINFAEKVSRLPSPFATGISGTMAQMKKRILNIAAYQPASRQKSLHGLVSYMMIAVLLSGFAPLLTIHAAGSGSHYAFQEKGKTIAHLNLDSAFGQNYGSFVLYDSASDVWQIYNKETAATRVAPVSTYKIYSALLGLETGLISPEQSQIAWNGQNYRYDTWNTDQTLRTAMQNSVTWYFQTLDQSAGLPAIRNFIRKIGYGNQTVGENPASYWGDSSLLISPIEQVELLRKFYENQFGFAPENVETVKDSLRLYTAENATLYGKTGTGEENGQNVLGWFIGYLEKDGKVYYFAVNIQNEKDTDGTAATALTLEILEALGLWK
ncbi:MAG: BlaR1 family beta-lactam sensor/signal transducer [Lachnospiraceae bacterium]|nr:BlaR1 family beta-lactam sensor/signal transducer [Lachnospiraceae bacterium]